MHLLLTAAFRGSSWERNSFITLIIQNGFLLQEQEIQKSQKKKNSGVIKILQKKKSKSRAEETYMRYHSSFLLTQQISSLSPVYKWTYSIKINDDGRESAIVMPDYRMRRAQINWWHFIHNNVIDTNNQLKRLKSLRGLRLRFHFPDAFICTVPILSGYPIKVLTFFLVKTIIKTLAKDNVSRQCMLSNVLVT